MKWSKILNKKTLSLFIIGLFIFTAFTMIQSGGTNTVYNKSVSTSVHSYTATSNGLNYTTEPNGTYLWNGHYLRNPPVPYPAVPTIAPDGLPYGAVGPVGAQGHVGPYQYTPGTPHYTGDKWNSTDGKTTYINTTTNWINETIYIGGNISVNSQIDTKYFNITGSTIIFNETPSGSEYSYGINSTSYFGGNGQPAIIHITNSTIETNATDTNPFWIGSYPSPFYSITYIVVNSTFHNTIGQPLKDEYTTSIGIPAGSGSLTTHVGTFGYATQTSFFNYSCYYGGNNFEDGFFMSNVYHSKFINMSFASSDAFSTPSHVNNSTFDNSIFISGSTSNTFNYTTFDHMYSGNITSTDASYYHSWFDNSNMTNAMGAGGFLNNDTISNITLGPIVNLMFQGSGSVNHVTIENITTNFTSATEPFFRGLSGLYGFNYSIFKDWHDLRNADPGSLGFEYFYGDLFENWSANHSGPAYITSQAPNKLVLTHDFFINMKGTNTIQAYSNSTVSNNIFVNISDGNLGSTSNGYAVSVGVGLGGGITRNTIVENNIIYGLYNETYGYTSGYAGGGFNITYNNNIAYDVDTSSVMNWMVSSQDTICNTEGSFALSYYYGPHAGLSSVMQPKNSTLVSFRNDTIAQLWIVDTVGQTNVFEPFKPYHFNITLDNTYVPSTFLTLTNNSGSNAMMDSGSLHPVSMNLFNQTKGSHWSLGNSTMWEVGNSTNPYFLNLTGYLGIYSGQTYTLNASNIKGEANLPIYYSGNEIADIPSSTAHYNLTVLDTNKYSISTSSSKSDPVKLYFTGVPYAMYNVEMINNGNVVSTFKEQANSKGVLNTTYNPANMPLDPIFTVSYLGFSTSSPVHKTFDYTLLIGLSASFVFIALIYYVAENRKGGSGGGGERRI